jgi:2-polyprenyl-6-hydroxyphenyl methylase/3-demethylubiquinone-9 3-methyltransferase
MVLPLALSSAVSYYETYWTDAGYKPVRESTPDSLAALFRRHIGPADSVLDLGCGDGRSGTYLAAHAAAYKGVDVSSEAVKLARVRGLDVERITDASVLPFPHGTFDVVVCIEVLEHLFEPQLAVAEALRVLKPGGLFLATVPNAAYWRDRVDALLGMWQPAGDHFGRAQPWRSPHIRFFSPSSLRRMLTQLGLTQVDVGGMPTPLFGRVPGLRRFSGPPRAPGRMAAQVWPALFAAHLWAAGRNRE